MLATIEIDLGPVADEWEPIAYRKAKDREFFYFGGSIFNDKAERPRHDVIIVRRKWVWPSWLKARWYAESEGGASYCGDGVDIPQPSGKTWLMSNWREIPRWIDIPKIGGDWRQSLRENPNWRSGNGQKDT